MMKKRQGSSLLYIMLFTTVLMFFCGFAIDATITYGTRMKTQSMAESIALFAAEVYGVNGYTDSAIKTWAENIHNIYKSTDKDLQFSTITITTNLTAKKVLIEIDNKAPTYFLSFFGVERIDMTARAAAQSDTAQISPISPGITWATKKAIYTSDLLFESTNSYDTSIKQALGNFPSVSYTNGSINFGFLDSTTAPLSLGFGGYLTIKLPRPVVNKVGYEFYIDEVGNPEGYMVFAGIDTNPNNPYLTNSSPGAGLKWRNITCAAESTTQSSKAKRTVNTSIGSQPVVYGSSFINLGNECLNGEVSVVKYLRIIDDAYESNLATNNITGSSTYSLTRPYGEASSATPGADINYVTVLNYIKLIKPDTVN